MSAPAPERSTSAVLLWPGTFLWYVMAACTIFLYAVSVLAPWLRDEFGLTRVQLGAIPTVIFSCAALTSLAVGRLVDRHGPRRAMWWLFTLNGAALLVLGLAPSTPWVFVGAVLGGVGTAIGNPVTNQIITASVAPARRGLVLGVKQSGVPSAAVLTGVALPTIAVAGGWRTAMMACLVFSLAASGASVRLPREAPARRDPRPAVSGRLRGPVVSLAIYVFLIGSGVSAVQTYIVLFGVESVGLNETAAGWGAAILGALGVVSRIAGAPLAQRFEHARTPLVVVAAGALVSTILLALGVVSPTLFYVGAAGIGLTALAGNSVAHLAIVTQLPDETAGRASGAVQTGYYAGFILFPLLFGWTVDLTDSYVTGWGLVAVWFVAAVGLSATGFRAQLDPPAIREARSAPPVGEP